MESTTGQLGKAPPPGDNQATAAKPLDNPGSNEASARIEQEKREQAARDGHDPAATAQLRRDAEAGDPGKPLLAGADRPTTESPQLTRGSAGGPAEPLVDAQRPTVIDQTGQARPDLTAPGGTPIPQVTTLNQPGQNQAASTFAAPGAPVHDKNGPIWRHVLPHGGSMEVGLLDGLLYFSIQPDNGKAASVRLPGHAALDLRVALARTDVR